MTLNLTSEQVWEEMEKQVFAVLGMATAKQESRTVGIVYTVHDRMLYISTGKEAWKVRHIAQNPHVSLTVPIAKRIPFLPWIKIPAATITFCGLASLHENEEFDTDVLSALYRGMETDPERLANTCIIKVRPVGDFITYGVGVSLMAMRNPDEARGRVSVGVA